ncbi:transposase [Acetobacter cerevisiae]|nr:transposase [Acetobacter cerevisiae]MCP1278737.1 transposase [Acetobacter cerevisiae]
MKTGKNASASTRGYDGGKRVKGCKRHIVTDSLGLLVDVAVTPANTHDTKGGIKVLEKVKKRWKK